MDEKERTEVADLIRREQPGYVYLIPGDANDFSYFMPSFSEVLGWQYEFQVAADAPALARLAETGSFTHKIGETLVVSEFKVGLENVPKFLEACRRR
jgi:hypothetical protein